MQAILGSIHYVSSKNWNKRHNSGLRQSVIYLSNPVAGGFKGKVQLRRKKNTVEQIIHLNDVKALESGHNCKISIFLYSTGECKTQGDRFGKLKAQHSVPTIQTDIWDWMSQSGQRKGVRALLFQPDMSLIHLRPKPTQESHREPLRPPLDLQVFPLSVVIWFKSNHLCLNKTLLLE